MLKIRVKSASTSTKVGNIDKKGKAEAKYKKPATSDLKAVASVAEETRQRFSQQFEQKGRGIIRVDVDLIDEDGKITTSAVYEWFIQSI